MDAFPCPRRAASGATENGPGRVVALSVVWMAERAMGLAIGRAAGSALGFGRGLGMAVLVALVVFSAASPPTAQAAAPAPRELGGMRLDSDIETCLESCDPTKAIPLREAPSIRQLPLLPEPGFKDGDAYFGTCAAPGRILRLSFKFERDDRDFFDRLLGEYRKRFGKPDDWRGDPFHLVVAWKWSFKNERGENVSLILTHSQDDDYKIGNFVKLTNRSAWGREVECGRPHRLEPARPSRPTPDSESGMSRFIPR